MISSFQIKTSPCLRAIINAIMISALLLLVSGCASQAYHFERTHSFPLRERAVTQTDGDISVSASVPDEDEAQAIFGVSLYKRGIQPVWLEIVNSSPERIRFAPTGLDREYFAPLEASYMFRKGFSKEARSQMDQRFHDSAMPRQIPAGEIRSGYVFTHSSPGTKSFNIDLFGQKSDYSFAFFVNVPGFLPDHATVDFKSLYEHDEVVDHDEAGLHNALMSAPLTTTDQSGEQPGLPVGVIVIGDGSDVLKALLRSGWHESPRINQAGKIVKAQHLFGRVSDAVFRLKRNGERDRNELHLWMAPMLVDSENVWMAQITHFIDQKTRLEQAISGSRIDPNIDEGRNYFVQNTWYSQSLAQFAWVAKNQKIPIENAQHDFNGSEYFTDGNVIVTWLSGKPVSQLETRLLHWDDPSFKQ